MQHVNITVTCADKVVTAYVMNRLARAMRKVRPVRMSVAPKDWVTNAITNKSTYQPLSVRTKVRKELLTVAINEV